MLRIFGNLDIKDDLVYYSLLDGGNPEGLQHGSSNTERGCVASLMKQIYNLFVVYVCSVQNHKNKHLNGKIFWTSDAD